MAGKRNEQLEQLRNADAGDPYFSDGNSGDSGTSEASEARIPIEPLQWVDGSSQGIDDPGYKTRVKAPEETPAKTTKSRSRATSAERQAEEIGDGLHEKVVQFFGLLSTAMPVTGVYGVDRSERAVAALINIGKHNPKIMKYLAKAADGVDAIALAEFAIGLSIAVQVDLNRLKGDEMVAQLFGVTTVMQENFWDEETPANPNVTFQAPTYATV